MLNRFSRVRLSVTLWVVALQAPLSMRFSRQEYWSGLPYLPPGHLPNPVIKPMSPTLQVSLPSESPGKPKNTEVGSLSCLQRVFPTQDSNQGLLHCRWILYQLSHQESLVDHNKLWKILKEMGIAENITCLMRKLYTGQEATELNVEQQTA